MKTAVLIAITLIYSFIGTSCKDNIAAPDNTFGLKTTYGNDIYGTWVQAGYEDDYVILKRSEYLEEDNYGFTFF